VSPKKPRLVALMGTTLELGTHCGKIYVTINMDPETRKPVEVLSRFGKAGGCGSAITDGMTRMISYGLRSGMDAEEVLNLDGIRCHLGPSTCMAAVAKAFKVVIDAEATGVNANDLLEEMDMAEANTSYQGGVHGM